MDPRSPGNERELDGRQRLLMAMGAWSTNVVVACHDENRDWEAVQGRRLRQSRVVPERERRYQRLEEWILALEQEVFEGQEAGSASPPGP